MMNTNSKNRFFGLKYPDYREIFLIQKNDQTDCKMTENQYKSVSTEVRNTI